MSEEILSTSRSRRSIRYLRSCYQADNRELSIFDVFATKVQFRHFLEGDDDLLSGMLPHVPVAEPQLYEVQKTAALHRTEKELLVGSVFCSGYLREGGKIRRICSPLLLFPAEIVEGELTPFLAAELARRRINHPLLAFLASLCESPADRVEALVDEMPDAPLDLGKIGALADLLTRAFPELPAEDLRLYPAHGSQRKLERSRRAAPAPSRLRWSFATAVFLVQKSVDTRGVLAELSALADAATLSPPLAELLGEKRGRDAPADSEIEPERVPAILSEPQKRVLHNAFTQASSLVIGPPGTGKSFTIAAIAVDALHRGESVLVASKMNHAVDVVANKIEDILGIRDFVVRGGRKQYLKDLKTTVEQMLGGILPVPEVTRDQLAGMREELNGLGAELRRLEVTLATRSRQEQAWGIHTVEGPQRTTWARRLWSRWAAAVLQRRIAGAPPYGALMHEYQRLTNRHLDLRRRYIRAAISVRMRLVLGRSRPTLTRFSMLLRSRTVSRKEKLFDQLDPGDLLHAFPIWMVNLADAAALMPLRPTLFDLVVIDEATQCDIASCLPVLQRARRAVIVGDPRQLRHLSFLSRARQRRAGQRAGIDAAEIEDLDYRGKSILDLVDERIPSQDRVTLLDEHFRSLPPIIEFSNREFYRGRLKLMQERPGIDFTGCQEYHFVGGRRGEDGTNPEEADALVAEIVAQIRADAEHPPELRHSLGVLSPFSSQVELLTRLLAARLSSEQLAAHDVLIGTPFSFQGEERDVMMLSLAVDPGSHAASFRFLERPDVFNVAVTRARSRQVVFGSIRPRDARPDSLLGRYLSHLEAAHETRRHSVEKSTDPFLEQLTAELASRGYSTWPSYPVAGFQVDLVVERDGRSLGIDLVGYPGEYAGTFELERYRLFNRAGLRILPLSYSGWCSDRSRELAAIEEAITRSG